MKRRNPESSPTVKGMGFESSTLLNSRATALITLLTDFGTSDYYVGSLKGAILSVNSAAKIIDITHEIPPQDIEAAAFALLACYQSFPSGTIHLVVIDPGVGSSRRPIIARAGGQIFLGPDNGVFSYVFDVEGTHRTVHVTNEKYFRLPKSTTFHGRDVFAPVAAALSEGVSLESFGSDIQDEVRLPSLDPEISKNGRLKGRIIHVDHFGNCVTNIDRRALGKGNEDSAILRVNGKRIGSIRQFYSEKRDRSLFAIWGSAGFLEISAQNRSAAKILSAKRGDAVVVDFV